MSLQNILVDHVLPQLQTLALLYLMRYLNGGSNFINWHQRLRDTLNSNNLLYVIYKLLGDTPGTPRARMIMVIIVIAVAFPL